MRQTQSRASCSRKTLRRIGHYVIFTTKRNAGGELRHKRHDTPNFGLRVNKQEDENCKCQRSNHIFNVIGDSLSATHNYLYA